MTIIKFIYALIDPTNESVFYIGQTTDVSKRFIGHIQESKYLRYPKDQAIVEILKKGSLPYLKVLEEVRVDDPSNDRLTSEREKYWTMFYSEKVTLYNQQNNMENLLSNKKCDYCQTEFHGFTPRSRFCSSSCRVYWHREQKSGKAVKPRVQAKKDGAIPESKPKQDALLDYYINSAGWKIRFKPDFSKMPKEIKEYNEKEQWKMQAYQEQLIKFHKNKS